MLILVILLASFGAAFGTTCDIFDSASPATPCVAAHSTVRALYKVISTSISSWYPHSSPPSLINLSLQAFNGPLYQVRRVSDNTTKDIGVLSAGGLADSKSLDSFCGSTHCVVWRIYDQTKYKNRKCPWSVVFRQRPPSSRAFARP
jgi:hypothetical protein